MTIENEKGGTVHLCKGCLLESGNEEVSEGESINPEAVTIITPQSVQEAVA
jgi:hypothetical protein